MKTQTKFRLWISLAIVISLLVLPTAVFAQDGPADPDPVGDGEVGEPGEPEIEPEPGGGDMEGGDADAAEGGDMEGGDADAAEGGDMESGDAGAAEGGEGEAPEYLPVTGGSTQATTSMVVLAVLGLLFAGAFVTRKLQREA